MRFLIDMNLSPLWVARLEEGGYDSVHWRDLGRADAPDSEILEFARENGFIVFTQDLDFGAILSQTGDDSPSVVQVREQNVDPESVGDAVLAALAQCRAVLIEGALVTIDLRRAKAKSLPIRRHLRTDE
ncbi:hypothetical protein EON81_00550 [bacterium]|nr:MAG: hypothetical protein EON81_00550 [bacterium]